MLYFLMGNTTKVLKHEDKTKGNETMHINLLLHCLRFIMAILCRTHTVQQSLHFYYCNNCLGLKVNTT